MSPENMKDLANIRFESAVEYIRDAEYLLESDAYKSANNRSFYATEKALKAVLAIKGKDAVSHSGVIKTFNKEFIYNKNEFFDYSDFEMIKKMERIRGLSDYDDFYIAKKSDCIEQVNNARTIIEKVKRFLGAEGCF